MSLSHPSSDQARAAASAAGVANLVDYLREVAPQLSADYLVHNAVVPIAMSEMELVLGTWVETIDPQVVDAFAAKFGRPVRAISLAERELRAAINEVYFSESADRIIADYGDVDVAVRGGVITGHDLLQLANEPPVIQLVNVLLKDAIALSASDVHVESTPVGLRVRYRIDGVLQDVATPPAAMQAAVISRIKVMADLDIAERRKPQDGRIALRMRDASVDVRVSTVPSLHGESIVMRLLNRGVERVKLTELGMSDSTFQQFAAALRGSSGVVLVTGPTGSGKTTSLYAAVDYIRTGEQKILSVEDPVEYELEGVPQITANGMGGISFASALRAVLRQDPDVLLIGEVRDSETAVIAMQASLTGHLVLSSMHTIDAPSAIIRLIDLGVDPYLIASSIRAIVAQRLVRRNCPNCCGPTAGAGSHDLSEPVIRGAGCAMCRQTGYRGRVGVFQIFVLDDEIRAAVYRRADVESLRQLGSARGMHSLERDALRHVRSGVTTPEEVARVIG